MSQVDIQKFTQLREKVRSIETRIVQLETQRTTAQEEADTLLKELQDKYSVTSLEEAEHILKAKTEEYESLVRKFNEDLDKFRELLKDE